MESFSSLCGATVEFTGKRKMRRKERGRNPKALDAVGEDEAREITSNEGKRFFACYLLTSLSPRHKGHTYIGFTVNPRRRIRQHNGEITCGAWRTKSKRPWEMVLCLYGFPSNVSALQFEWAWQHPRESLAVREAASAFKSFSGVANKIKLAYTMLNLPAWQSLNLTVNFFSTKYMHHSALCPSLPEHMKVQVCPMDELPHFTNLDGSQSEDEDGSKATEEENDDNQNKPENTTGALDNFHLGEREVCSREFEHLEEPNAVVIDDRLTNFNGFCSEETAEGACSSGMERNTDKENGTDMDNKDQLCELVENRVRKSTGMDRARKHFGMSDEVHVIDLLTPSPSCRAGSFKKKRQVPEFIDLTRSPNFIEL
ncbi:PREDICTED: structure-specific endonuclease subunit SLX1 [Tarenaya hassleriana]|uniref:structure-specific endonuclease subunit SLX1 n=1 Tax=Tarenaya hassleriana TaxID=28532 RepID=UPI00053C580E|nr:PREDICTED: structure-specific endonuclease subunit SLX1 [Tarenaya hassleriana]